MVFFDWDSAVVTPQAAAIIADAAKAFRETGQAQILVEGHTDRSGPARYNDGLSVRRAEAVKAELAKHGIAPDVVATHGYGENAPLIETLDGVREPQNRRVEITFP
ncbi:MAG: OmpA family protein [Alphaproteobacteria bacterium]|nr:MAG: OmpA family protein [Alphaproteobacteria bacterium]